MKFAGLFIAAAIAALFLFAAPASADTLSDAQQFVADINQMRANQGLGALTIDGNLTDVALGWSQKMATAGDISHNPNLRDLVTSNWNKLGENVGVGQTVKQLFDAFVNSPHHYANLVDPNFTHIGVGVVYVGDTMYTSHEFMQLRGASAVAATPQTTRPPASTVATTPRVTTPRATTTSPATAPTLPATTTTLLAPTLGPVRSDWLDFILEMIQRSDPKYVLGPPPG